jgi:histidyl-tRNA synthetase
MTLRPEGTAPVARAYVEHGMHILPQPVKLYYHSPMFRYESPQSGRYRQHSQLGIEAIGSASPELDAEVIGVLAALYDRLGLRGLELRLNSMGCPECRPAYVQALRTFLSGKTGVLCRECEERSQVNPLRVYDCKVESCRGALEEAPRLTDHLCNACSDHHQRVRTFLEIQSLAHVADPTLVRGMDYYTRTTFEFSSPLLGAQSGVGGGGRYDDLVEAIGGPPVPGVGFGTGVERILLCLERSGVQPPSERCPSVYLVALNPEAREAAFAFAHDLRRAGVDTELDFMGRSGKGQMKQAGRSGARYAFILGEQEMLDGVVTVRDLQAGSERSMERVEALELVAEGHSAC